MSANNTTTDGNDARPTRVVLYARVSTQKQADKGTSIETQLERLRALAKAHDWVIIDEFKDEGVSGATAQRPGLQNVLAAVRLGRCDAVAAFSLDRWARKLRLLLEIIDEIDEADVAFHSLREGWNTGTPTGRFGVHLMAAVAELERDLISERTSAGRRKRIEQGLWAGGKPPYGYARSEEDGSLVIVESEAASVRHIFMRFANLRIGLPRLRQLLAEDGIRSPRDKQFWAQGILHRLLINNVYIGTHALGIPAPAIIDQETWDKVQNRLRTNKRLHPTRKQSLPLQGRMKCGVCGRPWYVQTRGEYRCYWCRGREAPASGQDALDRERCLIPRQPAVEMERAVWDGLKPALTDPASFKLALQVTIRLHEARLDQGDAAEAERLRAELEEVHAQRERLTVRFVKEGLQHETYAQLESEIDGKEAMISRRLASFDVEALAELERTKRLLEGAYEYLLAADLMIERGWRRDTFRFAPELAESEAQVEFRETGEFPFTWMIDAQFTPELLTEVLDRLDAEITVYEDHLEVSGLIGWSARLPIPGNNDPQASHSTRGLGRG